MQATIRHPEVEVQLTGEDGNVFGLIAKCLKTARRANVPQAEIEAFYAEVVESASYDAALQTMMRWFEIT